MITKIKTKNVIEGTIKTLDKSAIALERTKDAIVNIKEKSENAYNSDISINEYSSQKVSSSSNLISKNILNVNNKGRKLVTDTKNNITKIKGKMKYNTKMNKTKKGIKTSRNGLKNSKRVAVETVRTTNRAKILAQKTILATFYGAKVAIKTTTLTIKAIIASTKALIAAIVAGGWVVIVVIIVICLVGLLCSSILGIFFSGEDIGNEKNINEVISEINYEKQDKIEKIKNKNDYDDIKINSNESDLREVIAIYVAQISKGNNKSNVMMLNEENIKILKNIYWDMNNISFEIKGENKKVLCITISSKTKEEMMGKYNFNNLQKNQVIYLLSAEFSSMWSQVLYGTSSSNNDMVEKALKEVGNVGGEKYWRWYGFSSRVEWCAIFVSWIANESGYIQANKIPKFASCSVGVNWFQMNGKWKEKGYIPKSGDIIFFDWNVDGEVNHVGIVEKVSDNKIYTIEGNSNDDMCRQKEYLINDVVIFGFGILE